MRVAGLALLFVGLIALIVGGMSGCNTLFSWNGRHAVDTASLAEGHTTRSFTPEPERRYTLSIKVVLDRESVELREGVADVHASFPLVVRVSDKQHTVRAEVTGWLDPSQPPNVLYGHAVKEAAMAQTELSVERLVGPFLASSKEPLTIDVDLGPDRVGQVRVLERRLVVYDDALPPQIKNAFILAGGGAVVFLSGAVLTIMGWVRSRRSGRRKRGGIPAADVV